MPSSSNVPVLDGRQQEIEKICAKFPPERRRSALIPLLWMVQEQEGWVSQDAMREVADAVGVTAAEVYEVVSFYTMFQQKPVGRHHIAFCHTLSCAICGAHEAIDYIKHKYNVPDKGPSADGRFSIEAVECIGACAEAPAMLVGETLHGNLTPERIDQILGACK
jgi:NADH-quinone oxidoreductase subunit E